MNILLTGGTGYIGSHAAVALADAGHTVVLYDNLSNSHVGVVDRLAKILGKRPCFTEGDVRDVPHLVRTMKAHQVDAVMHFAGLKAVGESVAKPLDYYDNNVGGTMALLHAMGEVGVKQLVFSSSATVYGDPDYLPLDENHPTRATNPYGRTKLYIEELLADLAAADPTWRIARLRYFNPIGAHPGGWIGEDPHGIPNNLLPFIAQVASGERDALSIFGDDYATQDGTGVRDYIHVMDLAEGHLAALMNLAVGNEPLRTYNLGTGQGTSVLEMVRSFETASGRPIPFRITGRRPGDVAACYADVSRARTVLGWRAQRSLDDMCTDTWRFQERLRKT